MSAEPVLVDTNVLIYAFDPQAEHHSSSRHLLDSARNAGASLRLTGQILTEFYAVVTNHRRVRTARLPREALAAIELVLDMPGVILLPSPVDVVRRLIELVRRHPVTGANIFDVQLVATMLGNGVRTICTFNDSDFAVFDELTVVTPEEVQRARSQDL